MLLSTPSLTAHCIICYSYPAYFVVYHAAEHTTDMGVSSRANRDRQPAHTGKC
jgi:hypothetical protein